MGIFDLFRRKPPEPVEPAPSFDALRGLVLDKLAPGDLVDFGMRSHEVRDRARLDTGTATRASRTRPARPGPAAAHPARGGGATDQRGAPGFPVKPAAPYSLFPARRQHPAPAPAGTPLTA